MSSIKRSEFKILIFLTFAFLIIGGWVLPDYGMTWDEPPLYNLGRQSVQAYLNPLVKHTWLDFGAPNIQYYGSSYLSPAYVIVSLIGEIAPSIGQADRWHLVNFFFYLLGIWLVYFLTRRWFEYKVSFGVMLLFATQPIMWGHAFINLKDIPFMVGVLSAVITGLKMVDSLKSRLPQYQNGLSFQASLIQIVQKAVTIFKNSFFWLATLSLGLTIGIRIAGILIVQGFFCKFSQVLPLKKKTSYSEP
jgi:hypothetical protein